MGIWKDAHTLLVNWQMSLWLGTSINSGHQLGVSICLACHATKVEALSKEGLGEYSCQPGSSSCFSPDQGGPSPLRNSATCRLSMGRPPKSSTLGHDKSKGSALVISGAQDSWGESSASALCLSSEADGRTSFISKLDSLNVTCLLGWAGLGEGAHLFTESPVWPTAEGTCSWWPLMALWVSSTMWASATVQMSVTAGLSMTVGSSMADLLAQSLNVVLQEVHSYECLAVHISCHHQGLLIWIWLDMFMWGMGPGLEFWWGGWNLDCWQNLAASTIGHTSAYAGGTPLQLLRQTGASSQPLHHHRGFLPATSSTDTHHCRGFLYLPRASWVRWDPW